MSYLKIFPRSFCTRRNAGGDYEGYLRYDFEQYGHMLHDYDAGVTLVCLGQPSAHWKVLSTDLTHSLSGFSVFMQALNHYLFKVLQFDPVSQWTQVSETEYEYYFDRTYFDMDTQKFNVFEETPVTDSVETIRNLLRLKLPI